MLANFTLWVVGTLIASEGLADTALSGCDGELLAHAAHQEIQLVWVVRAQVKQFRLEFTYVAVACIFYSHCSLDRCCHHDFLTA